MIKRQSHYIREKELMSDGAPEVSILTGERSCDPVSLLPMSLQPESNKIEGKINLRNSNDRPINYLTHSPVLFISYIWVQ